MDKKNYKEYKNEKGEIIGATWKASREEINQHHQEEYDAGIL